MSPASDSAPQCAAPRTSVPARALIILACGLLATWLAAGSLGWIAPPLQRSLTWLLLGTIVVCADHGLAARPNGGGSFWAQQSRWLLAVGVIVAIAMTASSLAVVNILAVAVLLATVALVPSGIIARAAGPAALAAAALAVFRLLVEGTASGWRLADAAGRAEGRWAAFLTGKPLLIGASFGGLDFLVVMAALVIAWLQIARRTQSSRHGIPDEHHLAEQGAYAMRADLKRVAAAVLAIAAVQTAYLLALAFTHELADMLPPVSRVAANSTSHLGVWTWSNAVHAMLPWHLPVLAAVLQIVVAIFMFRSVSRPVPPDDAVEEIVAPQETPRQDRRQRRIVGDLVKATETARPQAAWTYFVPAALLVIAALAVGLSPLKPDLGGRRIVAYDDGSIDWTTTDPGNIAPGLTPRYGLLRALVASLGGEFAVSKDLNEDDLRGANVLIVLAPGSSKAGTAGEFSSDIRQKIWGFVKNGGSLLVVGEPETRLGVGENALNSLLAPTAISFRDDTANSLTERWEGNLVSAAYAATATSRPGQSSFSVDRAASVRVAWPAGPLLTGRWCWNELGSDPTRMAPESDPPRLAALPYAPGSRLGDLVLAAQQDVGQGSVVVLGDAACLSNDGIPFSYTFCGPLLTALAEKGASPLTWWRQFVGLAAAAAALALLFHRFEPLRLVTVAVVLALAVVCCNIFNDAGRQLLPSAAKSGQWPVIYVDGSHLETMSKNPWREDGVGRFTRVLAESKYLPLLAPDATAQRLAGARMLISIAPGRAFDKAEADDITAFVERGGIFLAMAGAPDADPSRTLLDTLNLQFPPMPLPPWRNLPETEPLGALDRDFTVPTDMAQLPSGQRQPMRFYSAWPAAPSLGENVWPDANLPVLIGNGRGQGQAFLLGDSHFALQKGISPPVSDETIAPQNALFWQTTLRAWFERRN